MFYFPVAILGVLTLLFLNELMLYKLGWLDGIEDYLVNNGDILNKGDLFYDRNYRNFSFVFGIPDNFKKIGIFIDMLVPSFMKNFAGNNYIPVIWIAIPAFVYGPFLYLGFKYTFGRIGRKEEVILNQKIETVS